MSKYDDMTLAQLEKKNREFSAEREEILEEQKLIVAAMEEKTAEESARKKVEAMSPAEKKVAAQVLGVQSIESEEEVGEPGAE